MNTVSRPKVIYRDIDLKTIRTSNYRCGRTASGSVMEALGIRGEVRDMLPDVKAVFILEYSIPSHS